MTINEAMRTYRLPNPSTPEDLECRWSKILNFGDKVILAGYYYNGKNKPCYFGATYLRSHLRIPDRRHHLRGHGWPAGRQRGRIRGRRTRHSLGDAAVRRSTP